MPKRQCWLTTSRSKRSTRWAPPLKCKVCMCMHAIVWKAVRLAECAAMQGRACAVMLCMMHAW